MMICCLGTRLGQIITRLAFLVLSPSTYCWQMIRVYKHYDFHFAHPAIRSQGASFSSYPGFIWSSDDFYILDRFVFPCKCLRF